MWNFVLSIFFALLVVVALWEVFGETHTFPHAVPLFDALLMMLASFRVTRLVVYDKIMRWFRELFVQKKVFEKAGVEWVELVPYKNGFFATVHDLLGCPWCIGFWSAIIITFSYFMFSWAWFIILFLALAGGGSLVQLIANLVGWKAENLKQDSHEKEARVAQAVDHTSLGK